MNRRLILESHAIWALALLPLSGCPNPGSEVTTGSSSESTATTGSTADSSTSPSDTGLMTGSGASGTDGVDTTSGTACGNGQLDADEACDDGNSEPGDGCDSSCAVEDGWSCDDSAPSACAAICGDGIVVGDECDDANTDPDDGCDPSCAPEAGWACDGSPSACAPVCGDAMIVGDEQCDADVGMATCADAGFDDGTLSCDSTTCQLDASGCFFVENLQNDDGDCGFAEEGCANFAGTAGNPQDLLECYHSSLTPPIDVTEVEYFLGADTRPLPDTLELVIHAWAGPGSPPAEMLGAYTLDPMTDIVEGPYTITLPTPTTVDAATFCVGFHGEDPADGFRVDRTGTDNLGETWVRSTTCGIDAFTELTDLKSSGNLCVRPTVISM